MRRPGVGAWIGAAIVILGLHLTGLLTQTRFLLILAMMAMPRAGRPAAEAQVAQV